MWAADDGDRPAWTHRNTLSGHGFFMLLYVLKLEVTLRTTACA